jgi:phosphoribosyl-AMP cyclohydrolase
VSHYDFAVAQSPSPSSSGGRGVGEASNLIKQAIFRLSPLTRFAPAGFLLWRWMRTDMMKLDFDKMQGLIPAVLQNADSGEVLMLGFMNPAALAETLRSGYATFFSRSRNQLWTKGETSGNRAQVMSISTDCDRDTLLLRVRMHGNGMICHQGSRSCFTESLSTEGEPLSPEFSGATE